MSSTASIFAYLHDATPFMVFWTMAFSVYTLGRIFLKFTKDANLSSDGPVLTELAGLPVTLIHAVCFYKAVINMDFLSMLIFAWWGPGFIAVIVVILIAGIRKKKVDWYPHRIWVSWACKLNYIMVVVPCIYYGYVGMIFAYSVWIINDQVGRLFLSGDADRLRRTLDDWWLVRLAYPAGLFIPVFINLPWRSVFLVYGSVLFVAWCLGVRYVSRQGILKERPADPGLLRNMVYFKPKT